MRTSRHAGVFAALLLTVPVFAQHAENSFSDRRDAEGGHPMDREHTRHTHPSNPKHPSGLDPARFTTTRTSPVPLPLPAEKDAFSFVVYGDRTGGPAEGIAVLKDSVRDTNLLEPDLVMTVGDLIQGYNTTDLWMEQMREFKGVMDNLICPWFPVAGNHDVYWRGPGKPVGEHEGNYEMHFGPLWYAFEHKNCWFIALYSDEGNAAGEKGIGEPDRQVMSDAQLSWLKDTLSGKAKAADHVFLFLHHPRWRGNNYGDDWMTRVHPVLVEAGNVSAVFAGHIHRMKYQQNDGIEYVTLATVGGGNGFEVPRAGNLHHFNVVTVRKDQIAMGSVPVGEMMDPREMTEDLTNDAIALQGVKAKITGDAIALRGDGSAAARVTATVTNPTKRDVEMMLSYDSGDSRWVVSPDHEHGVLKAGETREVVLDVVRVAGTPDATFRALDLTLAFDVLTPAFRYPIPETRTEVPINVAAVRALAANAPNHALKTGNGNALLIADSAIALPDGPFTLEAWINASTFGNRVGLLAKTESSDYGIFVSNGRPHFSVNLDPAGDQGPEYRVAESAGDNFLKTNTWHHLAGVYDGAKVHLYVDGALIASRDAAGTRNTNKLPLVIGADVGGNGTANSFFDGLIDEVRLSKGARYVGEGFTPARRHEADSDTVLLLHMDAMVGPYLFDDSASNCPVTITGRPTLELVN